ncbi:Collagen triple helix repeat [uncultured Caudovirales phage]|uniref:Collagen triple helix repeat n=1 Tax=uncultured Caudovirales phage TaxID=2100421 RepID=A0A6J7WG62_9CAUD|nr:Collagen triple helix repeat [uncultured Caudovirales phage]
MDIKKLTQEVLLKNMTPEQQMAVLDSVQASVKEAKAVQKQKIAENVDLVLQALKRIEADMIKRVDGSAQVVEDRVKTIKDGKDGKNGIDGKAGRDGKDGKNGADGRNGKDGLNGVSGERGQDGVGVQNAHIDFDGSLIIALTNGQELNVGEVVPFDVAEKIRVIGNGGGTSQFVIDTLADLQTQINNVAGGLAYKGTWNASTNSPTIVSSTGTNGWYYVVGTAGSTNLNGVTDWQVGDWAIFNGSTWQKIDQTNLVTSVAGRTGDITLTSTDVGLGNVDNKSSATVRGEITSSNVTTALGFTPYNSTNPAGYTTNTGTVTSVAASAGTGISVSGSPIIGSGTLTITNTAPDQTVALTAGTGISVSGTYPNFTVTNTSPSSGGTVTSVTGTSPIVSSGGNTPAISLAASYGDTQNPYASKTANYILAAPNGSSGAPTFRAIVAADIPTLNQNTTGSAAKWTTTRTLSFTGDVTGSGSVDGSANVATGLTLASGSVTQAKLAANVAGNGPAFSAYKSANQTISQNTTTKVTFDTESYDTNNNFASSTFTPTIAGYYQVSAAVDFQGTFNHSYFLNVMIYKNGANIKSTLASFTFGNGGENTILSNPPPIYMNGTTDYLELYVYSYDYSAAGSVTVNGGALYTIFGAYLVKAA